jgi:uncharacterized membrane protein
VAPSPREHLRRAADHARARLPLAGDMSRAFAALALRAVAGAAAGILVALASLAADGAIGWSLPLEAERVHDLLVGLTGAALTIAVFALWMRSIVVGLVAGAFPARTVTRYLDDRFQAAMVGWMVAAIGLLVTVTLASPPPDQGRVPPLATLTALTTLIAALLGILLAVRQASARLDSSDLLHQLAERALEVLEETVHLDDDAPPVETWSAARTIESQGLGWVGAVAPHDLVAQLPPGTNGRLRVRPGEFVAPGQVVLELDRKVDEATADRLRRAIRVERRRHVGSDLDATLDELIDATRRAAGQDVATAAEALRYLEVVLVRLVGRRLPTGHVQLGDRSLADPARPTVADHVGRASRQVRSAASADPETTRVAEEVLERLARAAEAAGDGASAAAARCADSELRGHPRPFADDQHGRA